MGLGHHFNATALLKKINDYYITDLLNGGNDHVFQNGYGTL